MQIDRTNYEIWLTDLMDGKLNSWQADQVKLFLEQNPDIREEFNDLISIRLPPSSISFPGRKHLKKKASDISAPQFEYLCTAYLENDLDESQKEELKEIITEMPEWRRTFDLIQKTRLVPETYTYRHKRYLLKRTPLQRVIRLSAIGISSAAAVLLLILAYFALQRRPDAKPEYISHINLSDTTFQVSSKVMAPDLLKADSSAVPVAVKKIDIRYSGIHREKNSIPANDKKVASSNEPSAIRTNNPEAGINKVPVTARVDLKKEIPGSELIASAPVNNMPDAQPERSKAGKFISKTFREKFLKEKKPADTPLNGYDVAEAGIAGLNKLFGWNMALEKKNDKNGQPKSVYFSSELLKINAPVRKKVVQP